ncbi:hypothetical protein AGENTSMITH_170 [Bacillus phage vB_BspM_AgentSmith]|nr:hypothetical protein AGENTSMITH_170 [Bacillus phage vB_BspM_AgentSmith]
MLDKLQIHIKELQNDPEGNSREINTKYGVITVKFHRDTRLGEIIANPVTVTSLFLKNVISDTPSASLVIEDLLKITCLLKDVRVEMNNFQDAKIHLYSEVLDLASIDVIAVTIDVRSKVKLTRVEKIYQTEQLYKQGYTQMEIANRLNVSQKTISNYIKKIGETNVKS